MRKKLIVIFIMLATIACMSFFANAKENDGLNNMFDALKIDNSILSVLPVQSGDTVIRFFNSPIVFAFEECVEINDVLNGDHLDQTIYAIIRNGSVASVHLDNSGTLTVLENCNIIYDTETIGMLLDNGILKHLPDGTTISNVYYFWGQSNHQGSALYYSTSNGDYVYYKYYLSGGKQYIFPANDFFGFMKKVYSAMGPDNPPGGVNIESVQDLTKFEIKSISSNINEKDKESTNTGTDNKTHVFLWLGITLGTIAVTTGIVFCYIRFSPKKKPD